MPSDRQRDALRMAARWHAVLCSDEVREEDRAAWRAWRAQAPENQWAWQRMELLQRQLQDLPGNLAFQTMSEEPRLGRRTLLKGVILAGGAATLGWTARQGLPWQEWLADQRSAIGERRRLTLEDGSRLVLNTDSAVDVRFDGQRRLIELHRGEILVETARSLGGDERPFVVSTHDGLIRALGTRFIVRQHRTFSEVTVLEHAVAVSNAAPGETIVQAGQALAFDAGRNLPRRFDPLAAEWANGRLVIDDWRLADLLDELARYRPGFLSADPAVADLRLSGAYPLDDTDRALAAIVHALPVRLSSHTRYWVRLLPKGR
ncbi:Anti-sigma factor, FecR family [Azotobacter vinelandii CA]|uniref:Anti-sigma factor, FecR family n=2 Tax=Azotobacter vinelandii TaxID=354 RepID=C1DFE7_AZOVD|nr:FecR domain-containing protein [Azotobacter vinelandii]ACO78350.1 Anti-sigma factor, FecR family [Azotobacter vinelandii DJ]AGK16770.1 Anti-sigma factor, FecR family [Azotobacter vinelandii CA]AGK20435.1 Anti-sigma factor, FecR family [Azotobacter vinelandii CA6]SFY08380.1 FecR family protein [Azotobacter vinelandii]GLK61216.1 sensor [Azotobacter vinelandii]